MAWNTLIYRCGHMEQKQLYGKMTERARIVDAAAGRLCPACRAKEATEQAAAAGLPSLSGSEKQIGWACQIRERILERAKLEQARMETVIQRIESRQYPEDTPQEKVDRARTEAQASLRALARLWGIDQARWWIDHRDDLIGELIVILRQEDRP